MAREYAFSKLPGATGSFEVFVGKTSYGPGKELPEGVDSFNLKYFYSIRIKGADEHIYEHRLMIQIADVPINATDAEIVKAVQAERRKLTNSAGKGAGQYPKVVYSP